MGKFNRRTMLRGVVGGAAVGVGLPFLDCFLDTNGQALAATVHIVGTPFHPANVELFVIACVNTT